VEDRDERIAIWERIAAISEPLGYNAQIMFGSSDVPTLTILRLEPWKIRLTAAGDVSVRRTWEK
jgi:hypothetical protein